MILPRKGNGDGDSVRYRRRRGIRVGMLNLVRDLKPRIYSKPRIQLEKAWSAS